MSNQRPNSQRREGHVNGQWVSSVIAMALAVLGLAGASMKIEDLLKVDCKVGVIVIDKTVLLLITLGWLVYVTSSTGPALDAFNFLPRAPRKVFIVITCFLAVLWIGMVIWTSFECSETCSECPKLALDSGIGARFLLGIAGSVCTCTAASGQGQPGSTDPPGDPLDNFPILEWRSIVSPDVVSQLYNVLHQYGIAVALTVCLVSSTWLSHTEWNTTEQDSSDSDQQPDIPLDDLENRGALSTSSTLEEGVRSHRRL